MVYVKHFDILGIETAQIPCVELQGPPTTATEGAVGLLGMDVTSEGREIYVCTAVKGAIYTWKSLKDGKDGVCVVKAEINDINELILTLSNGKVLNAGVVKGANGKDGIDGKDGTDGISVVDTQLNDNGELIVSFSDGTEKNVGVIVGAKGENGISVVNAQINAGYELIITLSNDTVMNLGSIKSDYVAEADSARTLDGFSYNLTKNEGKFQQEASGKSMTLVGHQKIDDQGGTSYLGTDKVVRFSNAFPRRLLEGDWFEIHLRVIEVDPDDSDKDLEYIVPIPCYVAKVGDFNSTGKIVSIKVGDYAIDVKPVLPLAGGYVNVDVVLKEKGERTLFVYLAGVYLIPNIYTNTRYDIITA